MGRTAGAILPDGDRGRLLDTEGRLCHGGTWKAATDWSLPNTEFANYFAHGDGTLGAERPTDADSSTTYEFGAWRPRATTPMRIR